MVLQLQYPERHYATKEVIKRLIIISHMWVTKTDADEDNSPLNGKCIFNISIFDIY